MVTVPAGRGRNGRGGAPGMMHAQERAVTGPSGKLQDSMIEPYRAPWNGAFFSADSGGSSGFPTSSDPGAGAGPAQPVRDVADAPDPVPPLPPSGRAGRTCLNEILDRNRGVLASLAGEAAIEVSLDAGVGAVRVDPAQVVAALSRMLIAARPVCGGVVRVATRDLRIPDDRPGLRAGRYAQLTVTCDGEPADSGRDARPSLLSVARGVVSHPGGQICVESLPDGGRTFRLMLPAEEP